MSNDIIDFYKHANVKKQKLDKGFKNHHILPASHILCIGGTGSGKSTALLNFLSKKDGFFRIMVFAPVLDPLYELLLEKIPEVEMYNNIEEFPPLGSIPEEDKTEKLIIFDDFITLKPKEQQKIKEYLIAGRKKNCSTFLMSQNYTEVPKTISRNINYFFIFKINDNVSINNIIKNHNLDEIPKEIIKEAYKESIKEPHNFFCIDLKGEGFKRYRHNFTGFLDLAKKKISI